MVMNPIDISRFHVSYQSTKSDPLTFSAGKQDNLTQKPINIPIKTDNLTPQK